MWDIYESQRGNKLASFPNRAELIEAAVDMAGGSMTLCRDGTDVFWVDNVGRSTDLLPCECEGVLRLIKSLANVIPDEAGKIKLWIKFVTRFERVEIITVAEGKCGLIEIPFSCLEEANLGINWGRATTSASTIGEAIAAATGLDVVAHALCA